MLWLKLCPEMITQEHLVSPGLQDHYLYISYTPHVYFPFFIPLNTFLNHISFCTLLLA